MKIKNKLKQVTSQKKKKTNNLILQKDNFKLKCKAISLLLMEREVQEMEVKKSILQKKKIKMQKCQKKKDKNGRNTLSKLKMIYKNMIPLFRMIKFSIKNQPRIMLALNNKNQKNC